MSIFNYLAITTHFTLTTFKKITNIKHETGMIFCTSAILYIISLIPQNIADVNVFGRTIYKYGSIAFVFFFSMIILGLAYFKKKRDLRKEKMNIE